jgi:osmotically-inducible protein OsmY
MKTPSLTHGIGRGIALAVIIGSSSLATATPEAPPEGEDASTEFIQTDVNADTKLEGAKIQVRVEKQIAILTGQSRTLAQAERAAARAIASANVNAVVNQVEVLPNPNIATAAKSVLRDQKMFRANDVTVKVSGPRVSLTGKVGTWDEKDLARELISEVPGVVAIDNKLEITFEGVRTDAQIEEQLRFLIKDDPLYEGLNLAATVKDGTVRLSGEVGSRGEYDRLVRRSYVTGIVDVQISGLSINRQLALEGLDDKDYTTEQSLEALHAALAADSRINAKAIRADMVEGEIALKGSVGNPAEKDAVEATARAIPGVLRVASQLKISSGSGIADGKHAEFKAASPPLMKPRR